VEWRAVGGLLVRHLVMPGAGDDPAPIFEFLARELSPDTFVNVMGQYYPAGAVDERRHPDLVCRPAGTELAYAREAAKAAGLWRID